MLADQYDVITDATLGNRRLLRARRASVTPSTESDAPENETEEEPEDEREGELSPQSAVRSPQRGAPRGPLSLRVGFAA